MFVRGEISFADGFSDWITMRIIFAGCKRAVKGTPCVGCHNEELWHFMPQGCETQEEIRLYDFEEQLKEWSSNEVVFDGISVIGGEPLDQADETVMSVVKMIQKYYGTLPIILYTGYTEFEVLRDEALVGREILKICDYLKCGPYIEEMRSPDGSEKRPLLGSVNQNLYQITRNSEENITEYRKIL